MAPCRTGARGPPGWRGRLGGDMGRLIGAAGETRRGTTRIDLPPIDHDGRAALWAEALAVSGEDTELVQTRTDHATGKVTAYGYDAANELIKATETSGSTITAQ